MILKHTCYTFILVGLAFFLALSTVACAPSKEKQEIINYIETMMPVMGDHADWYEDQNRLFQTTAPEYREFMTECNDLLVRMEKIYMDVETSIPPPALREFKHKWSRECQLCILAMGQFIQALAEGNSDLLLKAQETMFEANDVKTEATEELFDLLEQYDIDIGDLY